MQAYAQVIEWFSKQEEQEDVTARQMRLNATVGSKLRVVSMLRTLVAQSQLNGLMMCTPVPLRLVLVEHGCASVSVCAQGIAS